MSSIWNMQDKKYCEIDGVRVAAADLGYRCHAHLTFLGRPRYCGKCGRSLHQLHCSVCGQWKSQHVAGPNDSKAIEEYIRSQLRGISAHDRLSLVAIVVSEVMSVSVEQMRSQRSMRLFNEARRRVCAVLRKYDPNISTELLAKFLDKDPCVITKLLRTSYQIRNHADEREVFRTVELRMRGALERQVIRSVV